MTRRHAYVGALLAVVFVLNGGYWLGTQTRAFGQQAKPAVEFKVVQFVGDWNKKEELKPWRGSFKEYPTLTKAVNEAAKDGWEPVSMAGNFAVFRREAK